MNMTKFFVDSSGKFLGGFCGTLPPHGSIEVTTKPPHGDFIYLNGTWVAPAGWYKIQRRGEYPTMPEQLDMQYHDLLNNTNTWRDAVAAVKAKYPKPS